MRLKSVGELGRVNSLMMLRLIEAINDDDDYIDDNDDGAGAYLIFVIFFTPSKFLEDKIYTEKRQIFALNL